MVEIADYRQEHLNFKLNALVLLSLKPKGRAKKMTNITDDQLAKLVTIATFEYGIGLGFDSCSAHRAMKLYPKEMHDMIEPCEAMNFSIYCDYAGKIHPCSFAEGEWGEGIDIVHCDDFIKDVWMHPRTVEWRKNLLANGRQCPLKFT